MILGEMTDADKIMNPQHFGSDPADNRIRIRISPEIWIGIPDHFRLRLDALAEVCTLWAQSSLFYVTLSQLNLFYTFIVVYNSALTLHLLLLQIIYALFLKFQHSNIRKWK